MTATVDPARVVAVTAEANALAIFTPATRKDRRKQIRQKLREIGEAEASIAELLNYRVDLEQQLDAATEQHQAEAGRIQDKLKGASAEKRVSLRQQLGELNAALQHRCDDVNARLESCEQEIADLRATVYAKPSLEKALLTTGDPRLLLELRVAKRTAALAQQRVKQADKELAEHQRNHQYAQEQQAKYEIESSWKSERLAPKEQAQDSELFAYLELEATTAAALASEATSDVQRIEQAIRDE